MKSFFLSLTLLFFVPLHAKKAPVYQNDFATHQHILIELVKSTDGPIIEFGSGEGSTRVLHELCKKMNRELITLDDNREWLNRYRRAFLGDGYNRRNTGWHKIYFVPGKRDQTSPSHWLRFLSNHPEIEEKFFSICFIDQHPWLARFETLKRFRHHSQYIILHDCDYFPVSNIFGSVKTINGEKVYDYSDQFLHFKMYWPAKPWPYPTGPPTLVGSLFTDEFPDFD